MEVGLGGEGEFSLQDLSSVNYLTEWGAKNSFNVRADEALREVLKVTTENLPFGESPKIVLETGPVGKLPPPERIDVVKQGLAGLTVTPMKFHHETVMVPDEVKQLPPVSIMILVETNPLFGVQTEKMAGGLAILKWIEELNNPEMVSNLFPQVTTSETRLQVQFLEKQVNGVHEETASLLPTDRKGAQELLRRFVKAIHNPVGNDDEINLESSGLENSFFRFGMNVKKEMDEGRFPIVIVALDRRLSPGPGVDRSYDLVLIEKFLPDSIVFASLETTKFSPFALNKIKNE